MHYRQKQSGIALVAALLAVALATTAATYLTQKNEMYKRRTSNLLNSDKAFQYAKGMESFAMFVLHEDAKETKVDSLKEPWAQVLPPFEIPGGYVQGRLYDLQGRYNINNLLSALNKNPPPHPGGDQSRGNRNNTVQANNNDPNVRQFRQLISQFKEPVDFTDALLDWMDDDINPRGINGAEDQYYLGLEKPYRTGNQPIADISEIRLIKDVTDVVYRQLEPLVTVLPQTQTKVNVNTASAEVLVSLGMDIATAASLVTEREVVEFETVNEFLGNPLVQPLNLAPDNVTTSSNFFLLEATAVIDRGTSSIQSILFRDNSGKVRVVSRTLKTL